MALAQPLRSGVVVFNQHDLLLKLLLLSVVARSTSRLLVDPGDGQEQPPRPVSLLTFLCSLPHPHPLASIMPTVKSADK